jgi:hypothetical protein
MRVVMVCVSSLDFRRKIASSAARTGAASCAKAERWGMRPIACESLENVEMTPMSCKTFSAAIVSARTRLSAKETSDGILGLSAISVSHSNAARELWCSISAAFHQKVLVSARVESGQCCSVLFRPAKSFRKQRNAEASQTILPDREYSGRVESRIRQCSQSNESLRG